MVCWFVGLFVCVCVFVFVFVFVCLSLSVCLSLFVCLVVCLFVCLFVCCCWWLFVCCCLLLLAVVRCLLFVVRCLFCRCWAGGRQDGVMSRMTGESMVSHVSRRRRWCRSSFNWRMMMMDDASITDRMQQLARRAATTRLTLETMGLALVPEKPLTHQRELSRRRE